MNQTGTIKYNIARALCGHILYRKPVVQYYVLENFEILQDEKNTIISNTER